MGQPMMRDLILASALGSILVLACAQAAEPTDQTEADFTQTTCDDLAHQSDEERAFALIFYYGYLAGRANATTIDNAQVSEQLLQVREYCAANPESTVIDAFVAALK
jgi:hypothetical protein